jgi:ABC-type glycerol-3-phosphate transport system substrate-binding protein
MKKYTIVFALIAVTVLSACGNGSTTNEKTDSTSVQVDSTTIDSIAVSASTETSEIKEVE